MALTSDEIKLLNPTAPEFRPFPQPSLSIIPTPPPAVATGVPLPPPPPFAYYPSPPPPPPPFAYYPQPPMMVYYHHHHHHFLSSPKFPSPFNYFPKHDLLLPPADDGLGLITSPTSPLSPPKPANPLPKSTRRARGPGHPGRFRKHFSRGSGSSASLTWVKKKSEIITTTATEAVVLDPTPALPTPISFYPFNDSTSLMIRNIPVRLRRNELMGMLDDHCRMQNDKLSLSSTSSGEPFSQFDLLYLPIDFKRKGNKGYAFVNFTTWQGASRLYNSWEGSKWENCAYKTSKICQIHPAKFQGKELKDHFERSMFECETDEFLPVKLSPPRDGSNAEITEVTTLGRRVYGTLMIAPTQLN